MNREFKDYVNTVISAVLLGMFTLLLISFVTVIKYTSIKHMFNNYVDKPTVNAASPNTIKAPDLFTYKQPEPIIVKGDIETLVREERKQQVLSRGGSGLPTPKKLTEKEQIQQYVREICAKYDNKIKPEIVMSMIEHESTYNPKAKNGNCLGLMQVSSRWHADRAKRLGVTNFYDSYSNILLGVDYLNELLAQHKDISLVLMCYNMSHNEALSMYRQGKISSYARSVLNKSENYK